MIEDIPHPGSLCTTIVFLGSEIRYQAFKAVVIVRVTRGPVYRGEGRREHAVRLDVEYTNIEAGEERGNSLPVYRLPVVACVNRDIRLTMQRDTSGEVDKLGCGVQVHVVRLPYRPLVC